MQLRCGASTWITAVSLDLSLPTSVAFAVDPFANSTLIEVALSTTCSAVRMSPFESISKPAPRPPASATRRAGRTGSRRTSCRSDDSTVMSTMPGASCLYSCVSESTVDVDAAG